MPNQFNVLLPNQGYVSQYVPLPFDQINSSLQAKQKDYEEGLDEINKTQGLIKINADTKNIESGLRDKKLQSYNNQIASIADEYIKTGDKQSLQKIRTVARNFANDPVRLGLEQSALEEKRYKEEAQKAGNDYVDFYDPYSKYPGYSNEQEFKPFGFKNLRKKEDYIENFQSLVAGIHSDSKGWENYKKKDGQLVINNLGQIQKLDGSFETISPEKLRNVANANVDAALGGKGGKYYVDKLLQNDIDYEKLPVELKKAVRQSVSDDLYNIALKQGFIKEKSGTDLQNLPEHTLEGLQDKKSPKNVYERPAQETVPIKPVIDFKRIKANAGPTQTSDPGFGTGLSTNINLPIKENDYYNSLKKEEKPIFDKIAKTLYPNATEKELKSNNIFNDVETFINNTSTIIASTPVTTTLYQGTKGESLNAANTEDLKRNYDSRIFYSLEDNKAIEGSSKDMKDVMSNKDTKVELIGEFDPKNYFPMVSEKGGLERPLKVKINDKIYAVSQAASKLEEDKVGFDINKTFIKTSTQPLIEQDININSHDYKIKFIPKGTTLNKTITQTDLYDFKWKSNGKDYQMITPDLDKTINDIYTD